MPNMRFCGDSRMRMRGLSTFTKKAEWVVGVPRRAQQCPLMLAETRPRSQLRS